MIYRLRYNTLVILNQKEVLEELTKNLLDNKSFFLSQKKMIFTKLEF
jgi:hypothetical protein